MSPGPALALMEPGSSAAKVLLAAKSYGYNLAAAMVIILHSSGVIGATLDMKQDDFFMRCIRGIT